MADQKRSGGKEPQSYGSERDWLTGKTGQTVDDTPGKESRHDEGFYDRTRESESSAPDQGGKVSPQTAQDDQSIVTPVQAGSGPAAVAAKKVTVRGGDGRESYWKDKYYR